MNYDLWLVNIKVPFRRFLSFHCYLFKLFTKLKFCCACYLQHSQSNRFDRNSRATRSEGDCREMEWTAKIMDQQVIFPKCSMNYYRKRKICDFCSIHFIGFRIWLFWLNHSNTFQWKFTLNELNISLFTPSHDLYIWPKNTYCVPRSSDVEVYK